MQACSNSLAAQSIANMNLKIGCSLLNWLQGSAQHTHGSSAASRIKWCEQAALSRGWEGEKARVWGACVALACRRVHRSQVPPNCCHLKDHNYSSSTSKTSLPGLHRGAGSYIACKLALRQLLWIDSKDHIMPGMEEQSQLLPSPFPHKLILSFIELIHAPWQGHLPTLHSPLQTKWSFRSSSFSMATPISPKQKLLTWIHH